MDDDIRRVKVERDDLIWRLVADKKYAGISIVHFAVADEWECYAGGLGDDEFAVRLALIPSEDDGEPMVFLLTTDQAREIAGLLRAITFVHEQRKPAAA